MSAVSAADRSDPDRLRADLRTSWEQAASAWEQDLEAFYVATEAVSSALIDRLDPQPGQRLLELAGGRGDIAIELARHVAPDGHIICTDGAEAMVAAARRRAVACGLIVDERPPAETAAAATANGSDPRALKAAEEAAREALPIDHRPMELEWIDAPTASLDGVICRFGYMHCLDFEASLREARRVLRSGGRLVIAVWAAAAENPWLSVPTRLAREVAGVAQPADDLPGPFRLGGPGVLAEALADAGFALPLIEPVDVSFTARSLDEYWEQTVALSDTVRGLASQLSPARHVELRDRVDAALAAYTATGGTVAVPGRALCATAEA